MYITMWDEDLGSLKENPADFIPYDVIDEFSFDFFEPLGAPEVLFQRQGFRSKDKTT